MNLVLDEEVDHEGNCAEEGAGEILSILDGGRVWGA